WTCRWLSGVASELSGRAAPRTPLLWNVCRYEDSERSCTGAVGSAASARCLPDRCLPDQGMRQAGNVADCGDDYSAVVIDPRIWSDTADRQAYQPCDNDASHL